jgi:hypothetical protein
MGWLDATWHGLNFLLPAVFMGISVPLAARFFKQKRPLAQSWIAQGAINFIVCATVLLIGLVLTGRDGKMLTYLAMVLASASVQWAVSGVWRK